MDIPVNEQYYSQGKGLKLDRLHMSLVVLLLILGMLGAFLFGRSVSQNSSQSSIILPILSPVVTQIPNPTTMIGHPVTPQNNTSIINHPTVFPIPNDYYNCRVDSDCYNEYGEPKGVCNVPCQNKAVCRDGMCIKPMLDITGIQ